MGIRGELFSARFGSEGRTYFFNVKQNRNGDVFLSIVESKQGEGETFDRRSIVVFADQMEGFLKTFQNALKFIDKTGIKVAPDPQAYRQRDEIDEAYNKKFDRGARSNEEYKPRREPRRGEPSSSFREKPSFDKRPERSHAPHSSRPVARLDSRSDSKPGFKPDAKPDSKPVRRIVVRKPRSTDSKA
jgi:hypothetical protein